MKFDDLPQLETAGRGRDLLVVALCLCSLYCGPGDAADQQIAHDPPTALVRIEQILQQAGATSEEIVRFQEDAASASAADVAAFEEYLGKQSPARIARIVQDMRLDAPYILQPDSKSQPGVPHGSTFEFPFEHSSIYPGTTRKIEVFVPAEYMADKPACVYVGLDGLAFEAPRVFDNLIFRHEMPVTIAIGVAPGEVASARAPENPRFNRSLEFDELNDNLKRFLIEELFPEIERHKTPGGQPIRLSRDPNDRAAGGVSTGGIGAFTLAWEHADAFRRVFTASGTFVGMRGGDRYPVMVRKTEPQPIRIFMQDGSNDGMDDSLGEVGDWWMSNQALERALQFAGYEVEHAWGMGPHGSRQGAVVFPEAMRYLWKGWPARIQAGTSQNEFLREILRPGEGWESVPEADREADTLLVASTQFTATGPEGRSYQTDLSTGNVWLSTPSGNKTLIDSGLKGPTGIALSPDGLWLAVAESRTHWGYSYRVQQDGTVRDKQRFYWFHVPDDADDSGAGSLVADREGRLYAATRLGVQVFDRNGRVRAILPIPGGEAMGLVFGGSALDVLYVRSGDHKSYRRNMKVPGLKSGQPVIRLPTWSAG